MKYEGFTADENEVCIEASFWSYDQNWDSSYENSDQVCLTWEEFEALVVEARRQRRSAEQGENA